MAFERGEWESVGEGECGREGDSRGVGEGPTCGIKKTIFPCQGGGEESEARGKDKHDKKKKEKETRNDRLNRRERKHVQMKESEAVLKRQQSSALMKRKRREESVWENLAIPSPLSRTQMFHG